MGGAGAGPRAQPSCCSHRQDSARYRLVMQGGLWSPTPVQLAFATCCGRCVGCALVAAEAGAGAAGSKAVCWRWEPELRPLPRPRAFCGLPVSHPSAPLGPSSTPAVLSQGRCLHCQHLCCVVRRVRAGGSGRTAVTLWRHLTQQLSKQELGDSSQNSKCCERAWTAGLGVHQWT